MMFTLLCKGSPICDAIIKNRPPVTSWCSPWSGIEPAFRVCSTKSFQNYANSLFQWSKLCQADDIQNEAKELSRIRDYLFNELAKNTGQPAERVSFVFTVTKSNSFYVLFLIKHIDSECIK